MSESLTPFAGSFRDPCGRVFHGENHVVRTINHIYARHWDAMEKSGFLRDAVDAGMLVPFEEIAPLPGSWKSISSPLIPFLSYPYEWSFSQLKDAALLTLDLMDMALARGLILKDASAFNIQFAGSRPVFIDHLSFEIRDTHAPWTAYLQFCRHFLAPLALMSKTHALLGKMPMLWVEGIPLDVASALLPWKTRLSPLLQIHIHAHARIQKKYEDARQSAAKAKTLRLAEHTVPRLCASLRACVESMTLPGQKTEWGDYYQDTNYTEQAAADKAEYVGRAAREHGGNLAVDLGANTGIYSRELRKGCAHVLAADLDILAVEKHYLALKAAGDGSITPLVQDLANPSPGLGWAERERDSFSTRCKVDVACALALIHHLAFGAGIPLDKCAGYFHSLLKPGGTLILEFVPLEDSQVQRLLAARDNVFSDYNLEGCLKACAPYFDLLDRHQVQDSVRTLLTLQRRA